MPTWSGILQEIGREHEQGCSSPFDVVRRRYLAKLQELTGHNVILYATAFTQPKECPSSFLSIVEEDIQGLMEVVHGLPKKPTDLIIHSPGGSAEAAEMMVEYLHEQYPYIRAIVPQAAMSAATMVACGANKLVMGKHSYLGPTDPQIYIPSAQTYVPAHAIIDQFELAIEKASLPGQEAWVAMLHMYGPALIVQCKNLLELSTKLVGEWLSRWMLAELPDAAQKGTLVAAFLSDKKHLSHGRHLRRASLREVGLDIDDLEADADIQDAVLSLFHAVTHTFGGTNAAKIIENHLGKAFIKLVSVANPPPTE